MPGVEAPPHARRARLREHDERSADVRPIELFVVDLRGVRRPLDEPQASRGASRPRR